MPLCDFAEESKVDLYPRYLWKLKLLQTSKFDTCEFVFLLCVCHRYLCFALLTEASDGSIV